MNKHTVITIIAIIVIVAPIAYSGFSILGVQQLEYSELIDSDNICIPQAIKQFLIEWLNEKMSDGYLIDAIQKYVDVKLIEIPFEVNEHNINDIDIPDWVKNIAYWWIQGGVSDKEFAEVINYLVNQNIITASVETSNEI